MAERVGIMLKRARNNLAATVTQRRGIPQNTTYEFTLGDQTIKVAKIAQGRYIPDYQAVLTETVPTSSSTDLRAVLGWIATRNLYRSIEQMYHVREAQKTNGLV
jgi:hypothetical protein